MPKITRVSKISVADIMRQKKRLQQLKVIKEKEVEALAAKELELDSFVKQTAKDILKGNFKYQLKVFDAGADNVIKSPSENSVWAPWAKLSGK